MAWKAPQPPTPSLHSTPPRQRKGGERERERNHLQCRRSPLRRINRQPLAHLATRRRRHSPQRRERRRLRLVARVHGRVAHEPRLGRRVVQQARHERHVRIKIRRAGDLREGVEHGVCVRCVVRQARHRQVALRKSSQVEAGDDAEVGGAALEGAEEGGVGGLGGGSEGSVGEDDLLFDEILLAMSSRCGRQSLSSAPGRQSSPRGGSTLR